MIGGAGYPTEKRIDAVAYELAERFFERTGAVTTAVKVDSLAEAISAAIKAWVSRDAKGG